MSEVNEGIPSDREKSNTANIVLNELPLAIERELAAPQFNSFQDSDFSLFSEAINYGHSSISEKETVSVANVETVWDMQPLDQPNFNPVDFINKNLLSDKKDDVDTMCQHLSIQIPNVEQQLQLLLRRQHDQVTTHSLQMKKTKDSMEALIDHVEQLQSKASRAETSVFEVTQGIKGLDLAKQNLTQAITFSKRLQMLVVAVEQLRSAIDRRRYSDASSLMEAVVELFRHFQRVRNIRPIFELRNTITELQSTLLRAVMEELRAGFGEQGQLLKPASVPRLAQACTAADLAHPEGRRQVIAFYTDLHIKDYMSSFSGDDEVSELQNVPQRFAWIKRFIAAFEAGPTEVFPESWGVSCKVVQSACEVTARDLTHLLEGSSGGDVTLMVRIMQVALGFEQQLDKKFPIESIGCGPLPFAGMFSYCFEPHLQRYIDREASTLESKLAIYRTAPPTPDSEAAVRVLLSSTEFLLFYQESLSTLSKLTRGKFLLGLAKLFAKGLQTYSEQILTRYLPREDKRQLTSDEIDITCLVLNTAHYCHESSGQLAGRVEELLDEIFRQQIQFESAQDSFLEVGNASLKRIVKSCEYRFESGWSQMSKLNWSNWSHLTSGTTEYSQTLISALNEVGNQVCRSIYYPTVYRSFCDRIAESFISRWYDTIIKINRMSEVAVQQIKEDAERILQQLFKIPVIGQENKEPPTTFQRIVKRQYEARIEKYLNLVAIKFPTSSTGPDFKSIMDTFFDQFLDYAPDHQFPTFLRLMEVKGIKRNEQGPFREALQIRLASLKPNDKSEPDLNSPNNNGLSSNSAISPSSLSNRISPGMPGLSTSGRKQSLPPISADPSSIPSSPTLRPTSRTTTQQRFQDNFRRFVGLAVQRDTTSTTDTDASDKKSP